MSNEQNILEKKCILKQNEPKKSHYYTLLSRLEIIGPEKARI